MPVAVDSYEFAALDTHITHSQLMGTDKMTKTKDQIEALKNAVTNAADPAARAVAQAEYNKWKDYKHDDQIETKPHFHEWASALPGMICVSRKARNSTFRNYVAAETATPVVSCCACMKIEDESNFYFAGVCRSKSVRPLDDGVGPSVDEFFTLAIGGMVTLLNNSGTSVFPGDMLECECLQDLN